MTMLAVALSCLWAVVANVAMLPRRGGQRPAAVALIATGIPLLGLVTWQLGPGAGFLAFGAGAAILRWPVRLRLRRRGGRTERHRAQPAE